jgi:hypothetical protein
MVVYVFTAPGVEENPVSDGLQLVLEILEKFGHGKDCWQQVFHP